MVDRIKECQKDDPKLVKLSKKVEEGKGEDFSFRNGVLWFRDRLCVPDMLELKKELLKESHDSTLVTHPGSTTGSQMPLGSQNGLCRRSTQHYLNPICKFQGRVSF